MLQILAKPWALIKALWALVFPMFAPRSAAAGANTAGRWAARLVLVGAFLGLLALLNRISNIQYVIPYGDIKDIWLPLLALCLYALIWLGWLLKRVLSVDIEPISSEFPDIDRAWSQAIETLEKNDIHLDSTPLYLVVGWTTSSEEALFRAAGIKAQVKQVPRDSGEPLHVTANRDAVWVTCPGISLLSQQQPSSSAPEPSELTLTGRMEDAGDPFKTVGVGRDATMRIEDLLSQLKKAPERTRSASRRSVDPEPYKARLRHLCRLMARDRHGLCPINGLLVLLPITAADPKVDTGEVANACRTDLITAFETFRMRCPVRFLVCNLEQVPGFTSLVERLPSGQTARRMGQRFPLITDLKPNEVPERIETSVDWIGGNLFPSLVDTLYQVEMPGGEDVSDVLRTNAQLFHFQVELGSLNERLSSLVRDCIPTLPDEPLMFGGCYFAGTGEDPASQQAFAPGVLQLMIRDQDSVAWTADSVEEDASFFRLARVLKIILIGLIVLGIAGGLVLVGIRVASSRAGSTASTVNEGS